MAPQLTRANPFALPSTAQTLFPPHHCQSSLLSTLLQAIHIPTHHSHPSKSDTLPPAHPQPSANPPSNTQSTSIITNPPPRSSIAVTPSRLPPADPSTFCGTCFSGLCAKQTLCRSLPSLLPADFPKSASLVLGLPTRILQCMETALECMMRRQGRILQYFEQCEGITISHPRYRNHNAV